MSETDEVFDWLIQRAGDRTFAIGPLVHHPVNHSESYFMVCSGNGEKAFHCCKIDCQDRSDRASFIAALSNRPPLVIHDFEDELDMAKFCAIIWPCEKTIRIRTGMERERLN